ncbi:MAG: M23 family metallopeptidase [Chloroflexota bacterium]
MAYRAGRGVGATARREPGGGAGIALLFLLVPLVILVGLAWVTGLLDYGIWWATNDRPPVVRLAAPADTVRGAINVPIEVDPADRSDVVDVTIDGRPAQAVARNVAIDTATLADGEHRLSLTVRDQSWRRNQVVAATNIRSDNTPPRIAIETRPERFTSGHALFLRIRSDEPATVQARLGDAPLELQPGDGFGWAVLAFPPDATPRSVSLTIGAADRVGNRSEQRSELALTAGAFGADHVEAPPALLPLLGPEVRAAEDQKLAPTYAKISQPRLWDGRFVQPTQGEIITDFGMQRSYNGGPVAGHHAGVDIAAPAGRPVLAANRGRVALIEKVQLRGNVLVIDHGMGIYTTYAHLQSIDVQPGQTVEKGQPVAKVGSTGLSTGPHLHWELWVNGANVDPLDWTKLDIP